jgi:hypothetical protein
LKPREETADYRALLATTHDNRLRDVYGRDEKYLERKNTAPESLVLVLKVSSAAVDDMRAVTLVKPREKCSMCLSGYISVFSLLFLFSHLATLAAMLLLRPVIVITVHRRSSSRASRPPDAAKNP